MPLKHWRAVFQPKDLPSSDQLRVEVTVPGYFDKDAALEHAEMELREDERTPSRYVLISLTRIIQS